MPSLFFPSIKPRMLGHLPLLIVLFLATVSFQVVGWPAISLRLKLLTQAPEFFIPFCLVAVLGTVTTVYGRWGVWLLLTFVLSSVQWGVALYQVFRILLSLQAITILKLIGLASQLGDFLVCCRSGLLPLRQELRGAKSYQEWHRLARKSDELTGQSLWRTSDPLRGQSKETLHQRAVADSGPLERLQLQRSIDRLREHIHNNDLLSLILTLQSLMKRDHCGVDSPALWDRCLTCSKDIVHAYDAAVCDALKVVFKAPEKMYSCEKKIQFFSKARLAMGKSALCLSGGGSLAMYHMGVCKAMMDTGCMPRVVSGTSGGSIVAGMLAIKSDAEMQAEVFVSDISTRYLSEGIRWFPPVQSQLRHFVEHGVLLDQAEFARCARRYCGSLTFEEAFEKTGRTVNIAVTVSGASSSGGHGKLLLNYVTAPRVLIWSAVTASCALPGIMKPMPLMAKSSVGELEHFMPLGVTVCDGSLLADLPMARLGSLFGITNFIVSQVNPHIAPFIRKQRDQPSSTDSSNAADTGRSTLSKALFRISNLVLTDVRNRCVLLSKLGLIPRFFGQDVGGVFKQRYRSRNVTIVPAFGTSDTFKAILNPTRKDMERYLLEGQRAFWPQAAFTRHLVKVESVINKFLRRLQRKERTFTLQHRMSPVTPPSIPPVRSQKDDESYFSIDSGVESGSKDPNLPGTDASEESGSCSRHVTCRQRGASIISTESEAEACLPQSPIPPYLRNENVDSDCGRRRSSSTRSVMTASQAAAELRIAQEEIGRLRRENEQLRIRLVENLQVDP